MTLSVIESRLSAFEKNDVYCGQPNPGILRSQTVYFWSILYFFCCWSNQIVILFFILWWVVPAASGVNRSGLILVGANMIQPRSNEIIRNVQNLDKYCGLTSAFWKKLRMIYKIKVGKSFFSIDHLKNSPCRGVIHWTGWTCWKWLKWSKSIEILRVFGNFSFLNRLWAI